MEIALNWLQPDISDVSKLERAAGGKQLMYGQQNPGIVLQIFNHVTETSDDIVAEISVYNGKGEAAESFMVFRPISGKQRQPVQIIAGCVRFNNGDRILYSRGKHLENVFEVFFILYKYMEKAPAFLLPRSDSDIDEAEQLLDDLAYTICIKGFQESLNHVGIFQDLGNRR
jgi:hypothetical protein